MFGTLKGRLLIVAAAVIAAAATLWFNPVTFGLDLEGGMYLALEVQDPDGTMTPEVKRQNTAQNEKILRNRINEFGVAENTVARSGDYRIIVELPGMTDRERAESIIKQQAFLEWMLVKPLEELRPALPRLDRAVLAALPNAELETETPQAAPNDTTAQMREDVRRRLFGDATAADTATADSLASDSTSADSTDAAADVPAGGTPLTSLLIESGGDGEMLVAVENYDRVKRYLDLPGVRDALPRGTDLLFSSDSVAAGAQLYRVLYFLDEEAFLTGDRLESATPGRDPQFGKTIVQFTLDRRGGRIFDEVTRENIGKRIAIVLDKQVHSAPVVNQRIGAQGQIDLNNAAIEEANDLALVLNAGAFTAPLEIVENREIGPSLGQDSIDQGMIAGIIGIVGVILIMVLYYRMAGVISVFALMIYMLMLLAMLAALGAPLTAPGIGGIILSLGMAVDANVLIFERIREELALGRTVRAAVDNGFQHAMSAIVDSNLTTLITGLILYQVGTGPVRGFAVTLSIGIVASFFTAVFITRTFFMLYLDRRGAADAISI